MDTISVFKFKARLEVLLERVIGERKPLKVRCQAGKAFVVVRADDWERDQETLHVLQSQDLMRQIADSLETHQRNQGYQVNNAQLSEIIGP